MSIITIGIDLAKNVFAVHGVDENGKAALIKPKVARDQLLLLIANLPPCTIGMEACSGAHHWARLFRQHGHTVKRVAPKFITPYRTCALSPSRNNTSKSSCAYTAPAKALSQSAPRPITGCVG